MSLHGENFEEAIRKKHLKAQLEFSFADDILHDKRNKSTVAKKAPVERSEAKVKLRFDTIIKIGSKCPTKPLEKIVSREHNICFACIAAVEYSLVWAQKDLREGEKRPRLHCPRMETVHFIQ